jgi:outer membrane protein assembly factor BamB
MRSKVIFIIIIGAATMSLHAAEQKQGFEFVTSCQSRIAIQADSSGFSSTSLGFATPGWRRLSDRILDVGPVIANDVVAVITNSFSSLYAFSAREGRPLWNKEIHSNVLASDGKYFYIAHAGDLGITALDASSGRAVWSLKVPVLSGGPYLEFLTVASGFLYTDSYVVDLSKRAVVHFWPDGLDDPHVISIESGGNGELLVGDSSGKISMYDKQFKLLSSVETGEGFVTQLASVNNGLLAATFDQPSMSSEGSLVFIDPDGHFRWRFPWTSDQWLDPHPFAVAGASVLVIEPGTAKDKLRMASRRLSDGNLNWTTPDGDFFGPPVVCGSEVYVKEGDQIRTFGLQTGAEQKWSMVGAARGIKH